MGRDLGSRPRAVLLTPISPDETGNGLAIRAGIALEGLAETFDVLVVLAPLFGNTINDWAADFALDTLVLREPVQDPFLRVVPQMSPASEQHRARLAYPRPMLTAWSTPAAASDIVRFSGGDADVVYVVRLYLAPLAEPWLTMPEGRPQFVLDIDEDDVRVIGQIARLHRRAGDAAAAALAEADAGKLAVLADSWIPRADVVLAAGTHEVARLGGRYPGVTASVLPNPAPPCHDAVLPSVDTSVDILFVATFNYVPNIDGARWFVSDVLPLIRERLGEAVRVAMVGRDADRTLSSLATHEGVVIVNSPQSVTPWYRATTVAVVPLRAGGGTRVKILEGFAHRRATISTTLGAEGLPVTDGVHLLLADTADDMANACARLLRDKTLRDRLVEAATVVASDHSRARIVHQLSEQLMGGFTTGQ